MIKIDKKMLETMNGIEIPEGHEKVIVDFGRVVGIKSFNMVTKLPFITWKIKTKKRRC